MNTLITDRSFDLTLSVLTLKFTLFHIIKKLMFITQRSTPTYFFGTDPPSPQKTLIDVPTLPHRWEFPKKMLHVSFCLASPVFTT